MNNNKNNGSVLIEIIAVAALILIISGGAGYKYYREKQELTEEKELKEKIEVQENQIIFTTSTNLINKVENIGDNNGINIYSNDEFGISFNYSNDWGYKVEEVRRDQAPEEIEFGQKILSGTSVNLGFIKDYITSSGDHIDLRNSYLNINFLTSNFRIQTVENNKSEDIIIFTGKKEQLTCDFISSIYSTFGCSSLLINGLSAIEVYTIHRGQDCNYYGNKDVFIVSPNKKFSGVYISYSQIMPCLDGDIEKIVGTTLDSFVKYQKNKLISMEASNALMKFNKFIQSITFF